MAVKTLPNRSEISQVFRWRLDDIFSTPEQWEAGAQEVEALLEQASDFRGKVGESADALFAALHLEDTVSERLGRVIAYARMRHDEDTADTKAHAMSDRATRIAVRTNAAFSYLVPEILAIPADTLERYIREAPGLELFRHAIEDIVRQKPHVLSAQEEHILAEAGDISRAPSDVFDMLNNADIVFPTIQDEEGNDVELTKGRYVVFMQSDDRRVRKDAFEVLYSTYLKLKHTLAAVLNAGVRKDVFYARMRKYG